MTASENMSDYDCIEICSFDDLIVVMLPSGVTGLSCPTCGTIHTAAVRTLSDLTNAAMEHLETHPEARRHALLAAA
jgi:hypothetical protein